MRQRKILFVVCNIAHWSYYYISSNSSSWWDSADVSFSGRSVTSDAHTVCALTPLFPPLSSLSLFGFNRLRRRWGICAHWKPGIQLVEARGESRPSPLQEEQSLRKPRARETPLPRQQERLQPAQFRKRHSLLCCTAWGTSPKLRTDSAGCNAAAA